MTDNSKKKKTDDLLAQKYNDEQWKDRVKEKRIPSLKLGWYLWHSNILHNF